MKKTVFFIISIGIGWWLVSYSPSVSLGPGVHAAQSPIQEKLAVDDVLTLGEYAVKPLASFHIKAKVLAKKDYKSGREADLSPTDLALGWGRMSDESVLDDIDISQSGRFYRWQVDSFPIPREEIESHSANMHLIPATDSVKADIDSVLGGEIVEIKGSLVEVESTEDGWRWVSSLTRTDTGNGACELILVDSIHIVDIY